MVLYTTNNVPWHAEPSVPIQMYHLEGTPGYSDGGEIKARKANGYAARLGTNAARAVRERKESFHTAPVFGTSSCAHMKRHAHARTRAMCRCV